MSKKKFDIYLEFNDSKLNIAAFNKFNEKLEYFKQKYYKSYFNDSQKLNFDVLDDFVEQNIRELEKFTEEFIEEIYLITLP